MTVMGVPKFRLSDMEFDFVSIVPAGDDPLAQVVIAKADPTCGVDGHIIKGGMCTGDGPCDTKPFSASKTSNWVARAGGLPKYIRAVAHAFQRKGMTESEAIQRAVGIVEDWAAGRRGVSKETQARAAAAVAEWNAKRAKSHLTKSEFLGMSAETSGTSSTLPPNDASEETMAAENENQTITKDDLDPEVVAYIEGLENTVDELTEGLEKAEKTVEETNVKVTELQGQIEKMVPKDDETSAEINKSLLEKADPALRALIEKSQKEAQEATEIAKAEREQRLQKEFISKAESLPMISESKDDLATVLRKAYDLGGEEYGKQVESLLTAANTQIAKGNLFSIRGSGGGQTTLTGNVTSAVEAIMKADPTLSKEQAEVRAYEQNPNLFDEALSAQEA